MVVGANAEAALVPRATLLRLPNAHCVGARHKDEAEVTDHISLWSSILTAVSDFDAALFEPTLLAHFQTLTNGDLASGS